MKVLQVVGELPSNDAPAAQPFVASQDKSLRQYIPDIDILDLSRSCGMGWRKYIRGIFKIRQMIKMNRYDVMHAHYSYCGVISKLQCSTPVIVSLMGSDLFGRPNVNGSLKIRGRIDIALARLLTKFVDQIIVKSDEMKRMLLGTVQVSVIPNGVDFELFKPIDRRDARRHFNIERDLKVILIAANPNDPRKNYRLARASVELLQKNTAYRCVLWSFHGRSQRELPLAMNASDALIMTSFWEGSPNVVKEAMACNLPIVSVHAGDVEKVINRAKHCYLVEYDEEDVASKLKMTIEANDRSNGRDLIGYLQLDAVARQLVSKYEELAARKRVWRV